MPKKAAKATKPKKPRSQRTRTAADIFDPPHGTDKRSIEILTKARDRGDSDLARAVHNWLGLAFTTQRRLAAVAAITRGADLRLAYPSLISVGHGFRRETSSGDKPTDLPCVKLLVENKRTYSPEHAADSMDRKLPGYLLVHATIGGRGGPKICAVPTDVESAADRYRAKPAAATGPVPGRTIEVTKPSLPTQWGVMAAKVRTPDSQQLHGLSCHHVLAMSKVTSPIGSEASSAVCDFVESSPAGAPTRTRIGSLSASWHGRIVSDLIGASCDVALIAVADTASARNALSRAVGKMKATSCLGPSDLVPQRCKFLGAFAGEIDVDFVDEYPDFDRIEYIPGARVFQGRVMQFVGTNGGAIIGGDSGSSIVNRAGTKLIAMHIAGVEGGSNSFALPAYMLMDAFNYGGASGKLSLA